MDGWIDGWMDIRSLIKNVLEVNYFRYKYISAECLNKIR
jgi:hypothetical protein